MGKDENKNVNGQNEPEKDVQGQGSTTDENGAGNPPTEGRKPEEKEGIFKKLGNAIQAAGSKAKAFVTKKHNVSVADVVIAVGVTAGAIVGIKTVYERGKKDGQKELGVEDDETMMLEDKDTDIFEATVVEDKPETEEVEEEEPEYEDDYEEETYDED